MKKPRTDKEIIKEAIRRLDDIRAVCKDFRIGHGIQLQLDNLKATLDPTYITELRRLQIEYDKEFPSKKSRNAKID